MFLPTVETEVELSDQYQALTKAECVFAAIWNNPTGTVGTEAIAEYYEVTSHQVLDIFNHHYEEIGVTEEKWTPRDAIRLGLLLDSPVAVSVRSLALDVIEAHKLPTKKAQVKFLLESAQFVEWSNTVIARIVECSHTVVNQVRKELEASGKVVKFEKRKHLQKGKEIKRSIAPEIETSFNPQPSNPDSTVGESDALGYSIHERPSNPDSTVEQSNEPQQNTEVLPDAPVERKLPPQYEEAIAQLKLQHKEEIEKLEGQLRAGIQSDAEAKAIAVVESRLIAANAIAQSKTEEIIKLRQKIDELESLRLLEEENKELRRRIKDLERSQEDRGTGWGNTYTKQAEKVVNAQVLKRVEQLEPELHLRAIALSAPPRKMYSEVAELLEQIRYQMDRVPLAGRRVVYEDRYGTLADINDENETAAIDWDIPIKSDTPDDVYRLADIEVLPTLEGIAQGSNVASCDVKNAAYSWHGVVVRVYPHTNEVDVRWREIGKIKCCRVSFLRLIMSQELAEVELA